MLLHLICDLYFVIKELKILKDRDIATRKIKNTNHTKTPWPSIINASLIELNAKLDIVFYPVFGFFSFINLYFRRKYH